MANVATMQQLLEAGVHFGHVTRRWNPKMHSFIFSDEHGKPINRSGVYILDLKQTVQRLNEAYAFVSSLTANGEHILFVGTKKQAQETIKEEAERAGQYYVNHRWLGGMLTNFQTIHLRIRYMRDLEARRQAGEFERLTKKEAQRLTDELERLQLTLGGIKDMRRLPGAIFVVDTKKEHTSVLEARRLEIPVIALADTNTDHDEMDYPIPANDDAIRAVKLLCTKIADAALAGRRQFESARERDEGAPAGGRRGAAVVRLEEFGVEPGTPAAEPATAAITPAAPTSEATAPSDATPTSAAEPPAALATAATADDGATN